MNETIRSCEGCIYNNVDDTLCGDCAPDYRYRKVGGAEKIPLDAVVSQPGLDGSGGSKDWEGICIKLAKYVSSQFGCPKDFDGTFQYDKCKQCTEYDEEYQEWQYECWIKYIGVENL